jgi:hypothetical protein
VSQPFGNLQKGSIDIIGCSVVAQNGTVRGKDHVFSVVSPTQTTPIEISAQTEEDMVEWITKIRETSQLFNDKVCNISRHLVYIYITIYSFGLKDETKSRNGEKLTNSTRILKSNHILSGRSVCARK